MLGRGSSSHADAVAAARRRLAAMAADLDSAKIRPSGTGADGSAASDGSPRDVTASGRGQVSVGATTDDGQRAPGRHADRSVTRELGRWDVTAHHLTIIALAVVAAVAVAGWWVLRSIPESQPIPVTNERVLPKSPPSPTPSGVTGTGATPVEGVPASAAADSVVVDVAGKVQHPGIVELPAGARVVDALREAGGATPHVDMAALNLARLLVDGEQIVVGLEVPVLGSPTLPASTSPSATTAEAITPVNLNTATSEQLDTLPGIGPVTAEAILTRRAEIGAFTGVDELLEVSGIGEVTLADIAAYVYV